MNTQLKSLRLNAVSEDDSTLMIVPDLTEVVEDVNEFFDTVVRVKVYKDRSPFDWERKFRSFKLSEYDEVPFETEVKYVRFEATSSVLGGTVEFFIVFEKRLNHVDIKDVVSSAGFRTDMVMKTLSAGFCTIGAGKCYCHGRSESIGIDSLPTDSDALKAQLGF